MLNTLTGLGISHWFNQQAPSTFIAGGFGLSDLSWVGEIRETWWGLGLFAGGGYEFRRYLSVEAYLFWGKPKHTQSGVKLSSNSLSLICVFNVSKY
jgi:hypothetical protein